MPSVIALTTVSSLEGSAKRTLSPTAAPSSVPSSCATRSATVRAAIRRGWVWPIWPVTPRPRSRQILGGGGVLPGPGAPARLHPRRCRLQLREDLGKRLLACHGVAQPGGLAHAAAQPELITQHQPGQAGTQRGGRGWEGGRRAR